jgi:hypothetical protein
VVGVSRDSNYHAGRTRDHCYFCGAFGGIEEHHVIPQRFGGSDTPDNIVGLCSRCHQKLERLYDKSFYEHFGIDDEQGERRFHTRCPSEGCDNLNRIKWQNTATGYTCYSCGEHEVDERRRELDRFEIEAEASGRDKQRRQHNNTTQQQ